MPSPSHNPSKAKRFRVAFSFAGEKRDFVAKVAAILAKRFGKAAILYDKYHEGEFSRSDLAFYLPDLYEKEADLVVAVFCPDYDKKEWCGLEWSAIFGLLKKRNVEEVMLTRFDRVEGKGLRGLAGYTDLDNRTPEQAAEIIIERLKANGIDTKRRKRTDSVRSGVTCTSATPNNLPRVPSFFGRTDELKRIADALSPKTRTWGVLIDGPGGMGKTSLAIRAAELASTAQFHRIFFLSCKERRLTAEGERPLSDFVTPGYLDMLNEIARLLKKPDLAKQPEAERSRLLIDALEPAFALLILDNLESLPKDQQNRLFEFLSQLPPSCKAIATSRRRTDVDARIIRLAKLDEDAALALIAELAIDRPLLAAATIEERTHLYEETGGNPLLLRWVAGQLGSGRCRTVARALDFLRNTPADNDPLEFIFGDLLERFTENETKTLAALTYFSQQVEVKLIAELANVSKTAAETALGDLSNRALVVPDEEERHFALVPMVAEFLRRKRPEVVAETGSRLEKRAYALILENGYRESDHFPALDKAWPTLAPALSLFLVGPNRQLQTMCSALFQFFNFTGRYDESLSINQQAEVKAEAAGDYLNAGWRAYEAGWFYYLRGEADAVLACARRAESHWATADCGAHARAHASRLRGISHEMKRDYPAAIAVYRDGLALQRKLSAESEGVAMVLNDLAGAEQAAGDLATAEQGYREALRVAAAVGYAEGIAFITGNLAGVMLDRGDWSRAEALSREALALSQKLGRQDLVASDSDRLAKALLQQGKAADALPHSQRAVEIFARLRLPDLESAQATMRQCEV